MKKMKFKLSFFFNIILVLIGISIITIFLSKGKFELFMKYFLIFVIIYTGILIVFLSIIFIVMNLKNHKNKKNKPGKQINKSNNVKQKNQFYFEDDELIRKSKKINKNNTIQDILDEDEALR